MHELALVILGNAAQIGSTDLYSILFEHEDVLFHYLSVPTAIDLAQKTMQQIVCKGV